MTNMSQRGLDSTSLYTFVLVFGLSGFELAAAISSLLSTISTPISIFVRATVALAAGLLFLLRFNSGIIVKSQFAGPLLIFWGCYFLRLLYASYEEGLMFDLSYYWVWAVGACALPAMALAFCPPKSISGSRLYGRLYAAVAVASVLAASNATSLEYNVVDELVDTGRLQLESLNPILLGHLGASLLILSIWGVITPSLKRSWQRKLLSLALGALGGFMMIAANSRGPVVSAIACLAFVVLASQGKKRIVGLIVMLTMLALFAPLSKVLEDNFGFTTYTRIFGQSQLEEGNTQDRLSRFAAAWDGFLANPLLGSSLEEPVFGGYPHNIFVEAFMTTGVVGGTAMIALSLLLLVQAFRIYTRHSAFGWVSLLFVQHLISANFSGSIYTVNYFWVASGLVGGISALMGQQASVAATEHGRGLGVPLKNYR